MRRLTLPAAAGLALLVGCSAFKPGVEVTALVGSALSDVCNQTAERLTRDQQRLADGTVIGLRCRAMGSGDVVTEVVEAARAVHNGSRSADDPTIPTLISLDGDLEQDQLQYLVQQIGPNADWIPSTTDSPAFASSPMVLMTTADLADGLNDLENPYTALTTASTHR